jgi:predicted membrane-bound mannosyltransferase
VKVILTILAVVLVLPLVLLVAVALGPVALAAAGILAVAAMVLAGFALADSLSGVREIGGFPEPTGRVVPPRNEGLWR